MPTRAAAMTPGAKIDPKRDANRDASVAARIASIPMIMALVFWMSAPPFCSAFASCSAPSFISPADLPRTSLRCFCSAVPVSPSMARPKALASASRSEASWSSSSAKVRHDLARSHISPSSPSGQGMPTVSFSSV
uniref:hypothetical protein n=1 Tax=Lentzea terrae TaxID=2200761 RepID=UPI000DD4B127|nr:hypothetical protein [Lentzea terrae]